MEITENLGGCPESNFTKGSSPIDNSIGGISTKTFTRCPICDGALKFGSHDPCEGSYYWCSVCDHGPINFPLYEGPKPGALVPVICDECGKSFEKFRSHINKRNFCSMGCYADSIRGVPHPERSVAYKGRFKGADNPNFKGDDVSYGGLHRWVYRNIPKPEICPKCNKIPETGRIEAHNISGKYLRDPSDWMMLCTKCHQKLDGRMDHIKDPNYRDKNGRFIPKILDADESQRVLEVIKKPIRPIIIAEEIIPGYIPPSPHSFLDPVLSTQKLDKVKERVVVDQKLSDAELCDGCPDYGDCWIADEAAALTRCGKLNAMRARAMR